MNGQHMRGFTLIELLITVVILGVIAAIAYPSYRRSVMKSGRSDAKVALQQSAQALERCYAQEHNFKAAECPAFPQISPNKLYTVTLPKVTTTTFAITAAPTPDSSQQTDDTCASFTLTNIGLQSAKDSDGNNSTAKCW